MYCFKFQRHASKWLIFRYKIALNKLSNANTYIISDPLAERYVPQKLSKQHSLLAMQISSTS